MSDHPYVRSGNANQPCAVYRLWGEAGQLLYVGRSWTPRKRYLDHRRDKIWGKLIATWTEEWFANHAVAESAELAAIRTETPMHNIRYKPGPKPPPIHGPKLPPHQWGQPIGKEWHRVQRRRALGTDPQAPREPMPMPH